MRIRTTMLALGLCLGALAAAPAFAATAPAASSSAKPMTAQQQKMATCSHESKGMKGDAHKKFMSDCLHGKATASAPAASASAPAASAAASSAKVSQREKMKTCNADAKAKSLKGADRKAFMSTCLKG